MPANTITLKLNQEQQDRLFSAFCDFSHEPPAYAKWQLRPENCVITCYESGKTVFQGKDAEVYAAAFMAPDQDQVFPQAGSDEVGTGDYFGPVCVCACIVRKEDLPLLEQLGVKDSKQITDEMIRKAAPQLSAQLVHSLLIVSSRKYNEVHENANMNAVKSMLHNQAYLNLSKKAPLPELRVIDQFTPEYSYYRYLGSQPSVIGGIHFETKAENKYPAVAAASMIARYAFLRTMDGMEETWGMHFSKGAGSPADECGREFVRKYGKEKLGDVAKLHFKNTERIIY